MGLPWNQRKRMWRKRWRRFPRRVRLATRPLRYAVQGAAISLLLVLMSRVSHESSLLWGRRFSRLLRAVMRRDRAIVVHNLELAFGDAMTHAQRAALRDRVFESIGMLAFEAAHSIRWTPEDYRARVTLEGGQYAREALARGKGLLLVTGHFGNWELMHPAFYCHTGILTGVISRDVTNPRLNERISAFRGRMGNPIFSSDQSAMGYMRLLRKGGTLAMLADQDSSRIRCEPIRFFGRPAMTPIGPGFLARKCGSPIVPIFIRRNEANPASHRMVLHPPIYPDPSLDEADDARRMMQAFSDVLESEIREAPDQWAWIHDRWHRSRQWRALREEKARAAAPEPEAMKRKDGTTHE